MADDLKLRMEADRGAKAKLLLESPIYQEAVGTVRAAIIDKWSTSPVADKDGQHELRLMLKLLNDVEANIKDVADTGKLANEQLRIEREKQSMASRILNFGRR